MNKLLIATKNPGKLGEMIEVLRVLPFKIISLQDLKIEDDVDETGKTHEENALLKARYFAQQTGLPTLGEDAGIYVDAFPGELGVETRRWKGLHHASDQEWIDHFLHEMGDKQNRNARFVSVAAVVLPEGSKIEKTFRGETLGVITNKLEAPIKAGIPISSCFIPQGGTKVYASLSENEKNQVSHRGKAMHQVLAFLRDVQQHASQPQL